MTAAAVTELIMRREGLDPLIDRKQYERVEAAAQDWLYAPNGRGARSGLPY